MSLPIEVIEINKRLRDYYGIETESDNPMWRVVWSDDEFEYRMSDFTPGGIALIHPAIQYLPKYRNYCRERWILERLVLVPEFQQKELGGKQKSYEPIWTFENAYTGNYLPAKWEVAQFVVDTILAATGKASMTKYKEMIEAAQNPGERINKLQEELFGDESSLMLRTVTGEAVAYNGPSKIGEFNAATNLDGQQSENIPVTSKSDG